MLARAQFMEGLVGAPWGTVANRASSGGVRGLSRAISKMLVSIDPVMDPLTSQWTEAGSTGLFKAAWNAAGGVVRAFGLDASDVLAEDMAKALGEDGRGSIFYLVGRAFKERAADFASGALSVSDAVPRVIRYAKNLGINAAKHKKVQDKADANAVAEGMLPGVIQTEDGQQYETGDFDADSMTTGSWGSIIAAVLANPREALSQEMFDWILDWVDETSRLTDLEKSIVRTYITELSVAGTSTSYTQLATDFGVSKGFISQLMGENGRFTTLIAQVLKMERPSFLDDMDNIRELSNLARGGGGAWKAANSRTAAEQVLRSKLIRLASAKPELRPYLLPILRQASEEGILAGRPWGGKGYKPKAKDYDDAAPGPGSPPCTPEGEGGCYEHTPMYKGYGSANSGANGSAARRKYNEKYRENM
jgi:hypothetical protein